MAKEFKISALPLKELEQELFYLKTTREKEVAEQIKEARSFGDLSENSEYDAAKEEQSHNESRINEIRQILATATIAAAGSARDLTVSIGTIVELEDSKGKKTNFTIVGTTETNSLDHKISNESPVGAALIGHKKGDQVEVVAPSGKSRTYTITGITR